MKGGLGVLPQKMYDKITTKSCNSRHIWWVHVYIDVMSQQEEWTVHFHGF